MDFADEHYVKLFTRDTVTWKLWPWEAKCLLPLLERKVDAAGFLPCGAHEPAKAVAAIVEIPVEVVRPGLKAMMETGTVELVDRQLLLVNFVAAQESRKTDKTKARDYRERKKAHARAEAAANHAPSLEVTVTGRHPASPDVTRANPPALPCSALPELLPAARKKRAPAAKSVDPRHIPMRNELIAAFKRKRGVDYPFDYGREDAEVRRLLKLGLEPTVLAAWERALDSAFPTISTLAKFRLEFPRFVGRGEAAAATPTKGASWTQNGPDDGKGFLEGLES